MPEVLHRASQALTYEEFNDYLARRLGQHLLGTSDEYATHTLLLDAEGYLQAATLCRDDRRLAFDLFDCLFGVDAREDGFHVVAILYSTATGRRIVLKHLCEGGRDAPVAPTLTALYLGADWHERETWDMFGIEFEGHPGLAPRILCAENFEGWPLRKDFYLASREAKPWPGIKEPAELDEDGNVIERVPGPGGAPGPTALDEAMAKQAKLANPAEEEIAEEEAAAGEPTTTAADADEPVVAGDEERAAEDVEEAASDAKVKAEERRKAAAEARARKAAERAEQGAAAEPVTTPENEVAPVPQDADRDPGHVATGGPPPTPERDGADSGSAESPIEGGMHEHVDEAREQGTTDPAAAGDPPVAPEGRRMRKSDEPEDDPADEDGDA